MRSFTRIGRNTSPDSWIGDGQSITGDLGQSRRQATCRIPARWPGRRVTTEDHRRLFDPAKYRIVLLDQRGSGWASLTQATPTSTQAPTPPPGISSMISSYCGSTDRSFVAGFRVARGSTLAVRRNIGRVRTGAAWHFPHCASPSELDWFYEGGAEAVFPMPTLGGFLARFRSMSGSLSFRAYHRLLIDQIGDPGLPPSPPGSRNSTITLLLPADVASCPLRRPPLRLAFFARFEGTIISSIVRLLRRRPA
jgi:proline iminopeptidase